MNNNNRKYPRITIREKIEIMHDGDNFKPVGDESREAICTVMDMAFGGACVRTNIREKIGFSLDIKFPSVENMETFVEHGKVIRVEESKDSTPLNPQYLLGIKFTKPNVNRIQKFMKICTSF